MRAHVREREAFEEEHPGLDCAPCVDNQRSGRWGVIDCANRQPRSRQPACPRWIERQKPPPSRWAQLALDLDLAAQSGLGRSFPGLSLDLIWPGEEVRITADEARWLHLAALTVEAERMACRVARQERERKRDEAQRSGLRIVTR